MIIPQRDNARALSTPEETRQRILAATRELFAQRGRRGTTTREIAERAGVNEATLFRHFGNKDALITECVQHFCRLGELHDIVATLHGDLRDDLCTIADALYERLQSLRDLIVRSLAEQGDELSGMIDEEAFRAPMVVHNIIVEYFARRVASGEVHGDPRWLAKIFMGLMFARAVGGKKFPDPTPMSQHEITELQVDIFLNGVRSK